MRHDMQLILPSDEYLIHQTADTFATVAHADISWTEKVWLSLFARDGSVQIDFGLGKYHNRNVIEGFGGVSRGVEQITVRASSELDLDPERTGAGPLDYEIIDPVRQIVRAVLRENDCQPISFDVTLTPVLPAFLERKDAQRGSDGFRIASDLRRFHQLVTVSGWLIIDGERTEITDDTWLGYRDRSWGVRMDVGDPAPDVKAPNRMDQDFILTWSPMYFEPVDGDPYEIHHYLQWVDGAVHYFSGYINYADGRQEALHGVKDDLKYDPATRRLLGGTMTFDAGWGQERTVEIAPVSDTGFHLGTALYFGFKGDRHGQYHGINHLDGERYADMTDRATIEEAHQLRDTVIRTQEGDATGYGIFESIVIGDHPRYGLSGSDSFL